MEFANRFTIGLEHIDQAIKDAEIFSEVLQIGIQNQTLVFKTEGSIGDMEYQLEADELSDHAFDPTGECVNCYAIAFLRSILKIGSIVSNVSIKLNSEKPFYCQFKIFANSQIEYFLAPRVEEEPNVTKEEE